MKQSGDKLHIQCVCGGVFFMELPNSGFVKKDYCKCGAVHTLQWDSPVYIVHKIEKRLSNKL